MKRSVRQLNKMMVCSLLLTFTLIQLGYATSLKAQFLSSASGFQAAGATYYKVSEHSGSIKTAGQAVVQARQPRQ